MSDDILSVIPADPHWQPTQEAGRRTVALVAELTGGHDEAEATWHPVLTAVDCGENLERIGCPLCRAEIGTDWWADMLEAHVEDGFATLAVRLPCCGADSSLDALDYAWPCGFARFEIAVWNPELLWFTEEQLTALGNELGHPVRQIRAHI
ncbi:hypothetical protein [Kitasatospora viridis]|uniref:Uncharacterized protein n=1 Tax=Kitasatospora viridis TaxID=281105 RepID=A0A561SEW0_9ACTN|nr:hypothetical protein [Kitasatospora viridis]TWF73404.1 hypothetical protein FHX73_1515 [Kitasatospora viridis]